MATETSLPEAPVVSREHEHAPEHEHEHEIEDEDGLRANYAPPRFLATLDQLDRTCRLFIQYSPFVTIATRHEDGSLDVSPRGDHPGFVQVVDDRTIAIPDRTGNNRLDCMTNLLVNPEIGMFFMIPGVHETLRLKGKGSMSRDPELIAKSTLNGVPPRTMLMISIHTAFIHCGKALNRSKIWLPDYRVDPKAWKLARGTLENSDESNIQLR